MAWGDLEEKFGAFVLQATEPAVKNMIETLDWLNTLTGSAAAARATVGTDEEIENSERIIKLYKKLDEAQHKNYGMGGYDAMREEVDKLNDALAYELDLRDKLKRKLEENERKAAEKKKQEEEEELGPLPARPLDDVSDLWNMDDLDRVDDEYIGKLTAAVDREEAVLARRAAVYDKNLASWRNLFEWPLEEGIVNIIKQTKSLDEAFGDMLDNILTQIIRFMAHEAVMAFLQMLAGGPAGGIWTALAGKINPLGAATSGYSGQQGRPGNTSQTIQVIIDGKEVSAAIRLRDEIDDGRRV